MTLPPILIQKPHERLKNFKITHKVFYFLTLFETSVLFVTKHKKTLQFFRKKINQKTKLNRLKSR